MKTEHPSSSDNKDTTPAGQGGSDTFCPSRALLTIAMIGAAVIGYQIHKSPDARLRLESLFNTAQGDLSERDVSVVAELLAKPTTLKAQSMGESRYVF